MHGSREGRSGGVIARQAVMVGLGLVALGDLAGAAFRQGQAAQRVAEDLAAAVAAEFAAGDLVGVQSRLALPRPGAIAQVAVFDRVHRFVATGSRSGPSAAFGEMGQAEAPIGDRADPTGWVVVAPAWGSLFGRGVAWLLGLVVAHLTLSRVLRRFGSPSGENPPASDGPSALLPETAEQSVDTPVGADPTGTPEGLVGVVATPSAPAVGADPADSIRPGPDEWFAAPSTCLPAEPGTVPVSPACSSLLLGIAEETRGALGVVSSMIELLHESVLEDRQRRYLGQLEWAAGNLDRLAAEVTDLASGGSDLEAPQAITFSPEALSEAAVLQAYRRGGEVSREWAIQVDPDLPRRVVGDAARIQAALAKVVEHALRTHPSGDACLRVRLARDRPGTVICWHVHIRPWSAQTAAAAPGLRGGVGWHVAEALVRQAQGVWEEAPLESDEVGVGFCVPVRLLVPAQPLPEALPATVVVVTGHAYLGEALALFMARLGCSVMGFPQAERLQASMVSGEVAPPAVCLDEEFAHDGDLVAFLRERGARVIALVSRGGSAPEFAVRQAGVTEVVGKPVLFGELSAALAASTGPAPAAPALSRPHQGDAGRKRILVAEDHALNREIVLAMLARLGRVGVAASDGHDAVDRCAREAFDLVLMDIQMPGLDGLEATRSIRRAEGATGRRPVPIVALTANVLEDDRPAALAAGMNDYLAKPITVLRLNEVLERWCPPETKGLPAPPEDLEPNTLKALPGVRGDLASPQAGRYVALFLGESRGQSAKLCMAATEADLKAVAAGCHRLKSAAAGVGAAEVARQARALEASIKSGTGQADVILALDAIRVALQRYHDAAVAAGVRWPDADPYSQDPR